MLFCALLGFIAAATYFFQMLIEMSKLAKKRRRKRDLTSIFLDTAFLLEGKQTCQLFVDKYARTWLPDICHPRGTLANLCMLCYLLSKC